MTGRAHERALALVASPDRAFHVRRDGSGTGRLTPRLPRPVGRGKLALLELENQCIQRAVEHGRDVVTWDLMAEQRLGVTQLVVGALTHSELQGKAMGSER